MDGSVIRTFGLGSSNKDALPPGYAVQDNFIYLNESSAPCCQWFSVIAEGRDAQSRNWSLLVTFTDPDGVLHHVSIPKTLLAARGSSALALLEERGFRIAPEPENRKAVVTLLKTISTPHRALIRDREGWTPDLKTFLLPDGQAIGSAFHIIREGDLERDRHLFAASGTRSDWIDGVTESILTSPEVALAVAGALAAPILRVLGLDPLLIHLRGARQDAMDAACRIGASVFMDPRHQQTWAHAVTEGKTVTPRCHDLLLPLPGLTMDLIRAVEDGPDTAKARKSAARLPATASGPSRPGVILTSGAHRLMGSETSTLMSGGACVVLDIDLPKSEDVHRLSEDQIEANRGVALRKALATVQMNYGTMGPEYLDDLLTRGKLDDVRQKWDMTRETFRSHIGADGPSADMAVLDSLAVLDTVMKSEVFERAISKGFDPTAFVLAILDSWRENRTAPPDDVRACQRTQDFIMEHLDRFQTEPGEPKADFVGYRTDAGFFIRDDVWEGEIHPGKQSKDAARRLEGAGFLIRGERDQLKTKVPQSFDPNRKRAYHISADILRWKDPAYPPVLKPTKPKPISMEVLQLKDQKDVATSSDDDGLYDPFFGDPASSSVGKPTELERTFGPGDEPDMEEVDLQADHPSTESADECSAPEDTDQQVGWLDLLAQHGIEIVDCLSSDQDNQDGQDTAGKTGIAAYEADFASAEVDGWGSTSVASSAGHDRRSSSEDQSIKEDNPVRSGELPKTETA